MPFERFLDIFDQAVNDLIQPYGNTFGFCQSHGIGICRNIKTNHDALGGSCQHHVVFIDIAGFLMQHFDFDLALDQYC